MHYINGTRSVQSTGHCFYSPLPLALKWEPYHYAWYVTDGYITVGRTGQAGENGSGPLDEEGWPLSVAPFASRIG